MSSNRKKLALILIWMIALVDLVSCGRGKSQGLPDIFARVNKKGPQETGQEPSNEEANPQGPTQKPNERGNFVIAKTKHGIHIRVSASDSLVHDFMVTPIYSGTNDSDVSYDEANAKCDELRYLGLNDWRLPQISEVYELDRLGYSQLRVDHHHSSNQQVWVLNGIALVMEFPIREVENSDPLRYEVVWDLRASVYSFSENGSEWVQDLMHPRYIVGRGESGFAAYLDSQSQWNELKQSGQSKADTAEWKSRFLCVQPGFNKIDRAQ